MTKHLRVKFGINNIVTPKFHSSFCMIHAIVPQLRIASELYHLGDNCDPYHNAFEQEKQMAEEEKFIYNTKLPLQRNTVQV